MSVISSEEFWAEFHERTNHMEEMLGTLLARSQGHREEDQSNSASSSRHQAGRDFSQIQNFRAKDPCHTSPSQVITLSPSLLENLPEKQPTKETPPSPSPLENLPKQQPTKETSTPPPSKDPEPITAQKKDQPPRSPQTPPPINPSAQTLSLPKIPAKTQKNDSFWPKPKVQPPPTPPKFPPCSPIDQPRHQPPQSPATLFQISSTQQSPYLKTTHCQPQTKRTKPKKPSPQLKPYPFHTDRSRRRKRARFKTRHFLARRKPLAVSKFGVNRLGREKKDTGWDKRGPKKKRQVRRANNRGFKFKVSAIRCSARKRLGKETRSWLRVAGTGQRQGAGLGRMGSDPEDPTERGSPPDGVSGHRRPPRRPPDGDYAKGGDSGVNHGSPEFSIEHRGEPPRDPVMDAEIPADDRQFPVSKVDRGACSGLTGGGRLKIGPEISGFFAAGEFNPESARGKWKEVAAGREGTHVRAAGGVKSGHLVERNMVPDLATPKWKIADKGNMEATIWGNQRL